MDHQNNIWHNKPDHSVSNYHLHENGQILYNTQNSQITNNNQDNQTLSNNDNDKIKVNYPVNNNESSNDSNKSQVINTNNANYQKQVDINDENVSKLVDMNDEQFSKLANMNEDIILEQVQSNSDNFYQNPLFQLNNFIDDNQNEISQYSQNQTNITATNINNNSSLDQNNTANVNNNPTNDQSSAINVNNNSTIDQINAKNGENRKVTPPIVEFDNNIQNNNYNVPDIGSLITNDNLNKYYSNFLMKKLEQPTPCIATPPSMVSYTNMIHFNKNKPVNDQGGNLTIYKQHNNSDNSEKQEKSMQANEENLDKCKNNEQMTNIKNSMYAFDNFTQKNPTTISASDIFNNQTCKTDKNKNENLEAPKKDSFNKTEKSTNISDSIEINSVAYSNNSGFNADNHNNVQNCTNIIDSGINHPNPYLSNFVSNKEYINNNSNIFNTESKVKNNAENYLNQLQSEISFLANSLTEKEKSFESTRDSHPNFKNNSENADHQTSLSSFSNANDLSAQSKSEYLKNSVYQTNFSQPHDGCQYTNSNECSQQSQYMNLNGDSQQSQYMNFDGNLQQLQSMNMNESSQQSQYRNFNDNSQQSNYAVSNDCSQQTLDGIQNGSNFLNPFQYKETDGTLTNSLSNFDNIIKNDIEKNFMGVNDPRIYAIMQTQLERNNLAMQQRNEQKKSNNMNENIYQNYINESTKPNFKNQHLNGINKTDSNNFGNNNKQFVTMLNNSTILNSLGNTNMNEMLNPFTARESFQKKLNNSIFLSNPDIDPNDCSNGFHDSMSRQGFIEAQMKEMFECENSPDFTNPQNFTNLNNFPNPANFGNPNNAVMQFPKFMNNNGIHMIDQNNTTNFMDINQNMSNPNNLSQNMSNYMHAHQPRVDLNEQNYLNPFNQRINLNQNNGKNINPFNGNDNGNIGMLGNIRNDTEKQVRRLSERLSNNRKENENKNWSPMLSPNNTLSSVFNSLYNLVFVELLDLNVWNNFNNIGNEMIITKTGRRTFPYLAIKVTGMVPGIRYYVHVGVIPVSNYRWKYSDGIGWTPSKNEESDIPAHYLEHADSGKTGEQLEGKILSFKHIKLTNHSSTKETHFVLKSMHHYTFRLIIFSGMPNHSYWMVYNNCFDMCNFVAVTAYQNKEITRLKIQKNPYAKGFLDNERRTMMTPKESTTTMS